MPVKDDLARRRHEKLIDRLESLMRAALKPGGFLSISEQLPDPDYVPRARLRRSCEDAGFTFLRTVGPWWSYTSTFRRAD